MLFPPSGGAMSPMIIWSMTVVDELLYMKTFPSIIDSKSIYPHVPKIPVNPSGIRMAEKSYSRLEMRDCEVLTDEILCLSCWQIAGLELNHAGYKELQFMLNTN